MLWRREPRLQAPARLIPCNRELVDPVTRSALRRLDWRFLLPIQDDGPFDALLLLGGDPSLADAAVASGLARSVHQRLDPTATYDAAALLHGADLPLTALAACLERDAPVYVEISRWRRLWPIMTAGRLRRTLRRVGLRPTGVFWTRPSGAGYRMFLPLEAPGALTWYTSTHLTRRSPAHTLAGIGLAILARLGSGWLTVVAPHLAVTAVARPTDDPGAGSWGLASALGDLPGVVPPNHDARTVLLAGGQGDWSRVVLMPFSRAAVWPSVVLKVPRLATLNDWTEHEQATLRRVRHSLGVERSMSLPEPRGTATWRGLSVACEGYVSGRSLAGVDASWRRSHADRQRDLRHAVEWLADFHASTRPEEAEGEAHDPIRLGELLAAYEQTFHATADEQRLFDAARAEASGRGGTRLPTVWQHADFGPWNVIPGAGGLKVLDWENARPGPALADLIYFTTHWLHTVRGHREGPAATRDIRELFLDRWTAASDVLAARSAIDSYLARLHIESRWIGLMLVYTFVEQAVERTIRLRTLRQLPDDPRTENRYVGYVEEIATQSERLFSATGARPWSN
jgi:aminoglycoside phosphotransferase (APT) family kinase protein